MIDLREIGPTYYFAPPRVFEGLLTSVMIRMEDAGRAQALAVRPLHGAGAPRRPGADGRQAGRRARPRCATRSATCSSTAPLRNTLGFSRVRVAYTAGEAIGPDLFTLLPLDRHQPEAALRLDRDRRVRLPAARPRGARRHRRRADRGRRDQGRPTPARCWCARPGCSRSTTRTRTRPPRCSTADGWYRTGDAGFLDAAGHLKIIDRAKDVGRIVGGANDGAMFAPKYVENKLKFFPYIKEAVAFGDKREKVCAFVNIDFEAVGNWAEQRNLPYGGYADLAQKPEVLDADQRVRREGQRRPRRRRAARRQPDQPLPGPAQGARRRRRRADAHAQGPARLHRRALPRAGRRALRRQERAVRRDRR